MGRRGAGAHGLQVNGLTRQDTDVDAPGVESDRMLSACRQLGPRDMRCEICSLIGPHHTQTNLGCPLPLSVP